MSSNTIQVLDKGFVSYMDHMGSCLSIVNAARVSFDKESEWEYPSYETAPRKEDPLLGTLVQVGPRRLSSRDTKLINYLAKHNHWTPFGQVNIQLRIKMPIFVARQMMRSNVGIVWNEVSRRYVDSEPEFYGPEVWRGRPDGSIKQGSGGGVPVIEGHYETSCEFHTYDSVALIEYNNLLRQGVAPEQARIVLPQSTYTEVVGNFTLAALARVCALREDSHAQWEIQQYAKAMGEIAKQHFPIGWTALQGDKTHE